MKKALCAEWFWPGFPDLTKIPRDDETLRQAAAQVAGLGYEGIELVPQLLGEDPGRISSAHRGTINRIISDAGLEFVGFHWTLMGCSPDIHLTNPAAKEPTTQYLLEIAELCGDLGGKVVVLGSPRQRNIPNNGWLTYKEAYNTAKRVLRDASNRKRSAAVRFAFEPLAAEETNFGFLWADGVALAREAHIGLTWDYKAMLRGGLKADEAVGLLEKFGELVAHVHVNDEDKGGPRPGGSDLAPVYCALKATGYDGFVSVEVFNGDTVPITDTARTAIDYMRAVESQLS